MRRSGEGRACLGESSSGRRLLEKTLPGRNVPGRRLAETLLGLAAAHSRRSISVRVTGEGRGGRRRRR